MRLGSFNQVSKAVVVMCEINRWIGTKQMKDEEKDHLWEKSTKAPGVNFWRASGTSATHTRARQNFNTVCHHRYHHNHRLYLCRINYACQQFNSSFNCLPHWSSWSYCLSIFHQRRQENKRQPWAILKNRPHIQHIFTEFRKAETRHYWSFNFIQIYLWGCQSAIIIETPTPLLLWRAFFIWSQKWIPWNICTKNW